MKNLKIFIVLIVFNSFFIFSCNNRTYNEQQEESFIKLFGTSGIDQASDIIIANNGDFILCGSIKNNQTDDDIWLARLDINGNTLWETSINDTLSQIPKSLIESQSGEIFVSAATQQNIKGINYTLLEVAKFTNSGSIIDTSFFPYPFSYTPKDMIFMNDSDIYILGDKQQNNDFELLKPYDIFLFKLNTNMDSIWFRTYGGINDDISSQLIKSEDYTIDIIGSSNSFSGINQDLYNILIFKSDTNGLLKDKITLGGLSDDFGTSLCKNSIGNYIVCGYTNSNSKNLLYTAEISLYSHQIHWQKTYQMPYDIVCNNIINDNDTYIAVGQADFNSDLDIFVTKLNNEGDSLWVKTIGSEGNEKAISSRLSEVGGYLIIGSSEYKQNQIITLLKISPNGDFQDY